MQNILQWMKGSNLLKEQRCFIMDYGFSCSFQSPYLKMTTTASAKNHKNIENHTHKHTHVNVGTFGLNSPNNCSIVVIGGKYLEQVDEVMRMVDKITEDIAWMPSAVFLMA